MRMNRFFRTMGPFVALAAMGALASGCRDGNFRWSGDEGVPLAELDLGGDPPEGVALMGPDTVAITDGAQFTVTVEGEAADRMRFRLEGGTLGIMREHGDWNDRGTATVRITMPPPRKLVIAGSGRMTSERLAGEAEVSIAGSGELETPNVDASSLEVSIAGSGTYTAGGRADRLELSIAGSGSGEMDKLKVERAEVNIAGSGDAVFASDGEVEANIMGSGDVIVRGSARCKVNSMGSGSLVCEREAEPAD
ncbi:MAG TPA: head GIN domain-containing protein [Croceibacterium sp.]|nr:head GIN domain-containing protein [Croceibacterium sp.]